MQTSITLIPEWEEQDLVMITWPHADTDWSDMIEEVEECYIGIAKAILAFEDLLILTTDEEHVRSILSKWEYAHQYYVMEMPSNDTWIRDYGPLSFRVQTEAGVQKAIADFTYNAWGMKFAADKDNLMNRALYLSYAFNKNVSLINRLLLVLEGGAVESDGRGTILSTYGCIYEPNRNPGFAEDELYEAISQCLGAERLILLKNGELEGDDTDGHVDTLARFLDESTIAYVSCEDVRDTHYHPLRRMKEELEALRTPEGEPYTLIPLPLPTAIYEVDGHRLPATYANFLFVNGGLLVPTYNQSADAVVLQRLQEALPKHKVVGVDSRALIRQHGSLHCATMQIPKGFINKKKWERES